MRCPKCGFISFDHIESCLKCAKKIEKTTAELQGTTFNANSPSFLGSFSKDPQPGHDDISNEESVEMGVSGDDFVMEADVEGGESFDDAISLEDGDTDDFLSKDGAADSGITMDFGQFEDSLDDEPETTDTSAEDLDDGMADIELFDDTEGDVTEEENGVTDTPGVLTDISDLSVPEEDLIELTDVGIEESPVSLPEDDVQPVQS